MRDEGSRTHAGAEAVTLPAQSLGKPPANGWPSITNQSEKPAGSGGQKELSSIDQLIKDVGVAQSSKNEPDELENANQGDNISLNEDELDEVIDTAFHNDKNQMR